jgi:hypothetical protein
VDAAMQSGYWKSLSEPNDTHAELISLAAWDGMRAVLGNDL